MEVDSNGEPESDSTLALPGTFSMCRQVTHCSPAADEYHDSGADTDDEDVATGPAPSGSNLNRYPETKEMTKPSTLPANSGGTCFRIHLNNLLKGASPLIPTVNPMESSAFSVAWMASDGTEVACEADSFHIDILGTPRSPWNISLFHCRRNIAKKYDGLRHHVAMLDRLGPDGMSSNESEVDAQGRNYVVQRPLWRAPELCPWLGIFDIFHVYNHMAGNGGLGDGDQCGAIPHQRQFRKDHVSTSS
ncbi:hypothetical protein JAAARDRAFT_51174 [Jaapia argillacea MUCL 33604]|uniref:Uncharacterized protein n=1 Tax=Jaapia argillacea MUCL 33604 TaxID=933084 RepID=A0A067P9Z1_9AGAM|nr:hypothetical protein JAAARDRAFT_51174 [Jaapia argillacea MUCL 33604]